MKRVPQRRPHDCGVCVVAILAGVDYRTALVAVFPEAPYAYWTTTRGVVRAFKRLGIRCDRRLRPLFGRSYRALEIDAVLKVTVGSSGWNWHWIAWDASRRRVLDPAKGQGCRWRVTSYLAIYRD